jgi:hypothetical protein
MGKFVDLTGQRFGRWIVIERVENRGSAHYYRCKCDCGNEKNVAKQSLLKEISRSCGCLNRELTTARNFKHGLAHTRRYSIYSGMIRRCYDRKSVNYLKYGGSGIKVCKEWLEDFVVFYNWASDNGYTNELTIDRINNKGDYSPKNCRWSSSTQQNRNTSRNTFLTIGGEEKTLSEWSNISGIKSNTIKYRYDAGWSHADIFNPVQKSKNPRKGRARLLDILSSVIKRCYNSSSVGYKNYGGRGIVVCDAWLNNNECFVEWAFVSGYKDSLTLDRINNNSGYSPDNCRWVTIKEQNSNKQNSVLLTHNDITMTREAWSRALGISAKALAYRIENNMTEDRIFHVGKLNNSGKRCSK